MSLITDAGVPAYLKSLVNGADAEKAYAGYNAFTNTEPLIGDADKNQVAREDEGNSQGVCWRKGE